MRINHKSGVEKSAPYSLFICSPTYSGELNCHFVTSLLQTTDLLKEKGIEYTVYFSVFDSLVARARNDLVDKFLKSDCTHILMIDSDQGWDAEAVPKMLELDREFLTGAVPSRKQGTEQYALKIFTEGNRLPKVDDDGLIACSSNGVAFGLIKRIVFEKIKANKPYPTEVYPYFQHRYYDNGDHYGEDMFFTKTWTDIGEVWIYPDITFNHSGVIGNYHRFLMKQPKPDYKLKRLENAISNVVV